VVEAFRQRASADPDHYLVIPASNPVDVIAAQILDRVLTQLAKAGRDSHG
jgi:hypothetical protein